MRGVRRPLKRGQRATGRLRSNSVPVTSAHIAASPIPANRAYLGHTFTLTDSVARGASGLADAATGGGGLAKQLAGIPGVTAVEETSEDHYRLLADRDVRPDAARVVVVAGGQLRRLSVEEPSLDAIYNRFFQDRAGEVRNAA